MINNDKAEINTTAVNDALSEADKLATVLGIAMGLLNNDQFYTKEYAAKELLKLADMMAEELYLFYIPRSEKANTEQADVEAKAQCSNTEPEQKKIKAI